jgi:hypothetical protein
MYEMKPGPASELVSPEIVTELGGGAAVASLYRRAVACDGRDVFMRNGYYLLCAACDIALSSGPARSALSRQPTSIFDHY